MNVVLALDEVIHHNTDDPNVTDNAVLFVLYDLYGLFSMKVCLAHSVRQSMWPCCDDSQCGPSSMIVNVALLAL